MIATEAHQWAQETFGDCDLGDKRRVKRLVKIATGLAVHSGKSLVGACGEDSAGLEGTYRFIENQSVEGKSIRDGGFGATVKLLKNYDVLIAPEDSTTLSFKHAPTGTGDLGGPEGTKSRGIWVHSALLVDPKSERTVGLLAQKWWTRPERKKSSGKKEQKAYEQRESIKWQWCSEEMNERLGDEMSKVISVCDRESDIWEYLNYKEKMAQRYVVRSSANRSLIGDFEGHLEEEADSWQPTHQLQVQVPQRGGRKKRVVTLEVAANAVTLKVPQGKKGDFEPLTLNVVQAYEVCPPEGESQLFWRLFTSEPTDTAEQMNFVLRAYALRWRVEDFHKAWKTGCKVEALRLRTAENLERAASILAFTAVRLLQLRERTEQSPETPCTHILEDDEWRCLWATVEKSPPPDEPPTLGWAHLAIARLAGWYGSKKSGRVGWKKYWEGYIRFQDLLTGWRLASTMQRCD